jgi:cytosine/adenosine deaminase-related metal-dependent hydrolase
LLGRQTDEFVSFLQSINAWSPSELCKSMDEVLELLNGFDRPVLVHGNYLTQHQWRKLKAGSSVVYCPRTHEYFGHRPHRYLEMAAYGVNVALGTDSLASNPDLSVLNEARFLWRRDRSRLTGPGLLRMAARNGAAVLDYDEGGTLEVGKRADFVVLPCPGPANDPWEQLFGEETAPAAVYVGGLRVYPS